jgi:ADP-ribose pyrophosphatase YjhB (NUDIX family)
MKYCSYCGDPVVVRIPDGDNRERHVCESCDTIHYHNPRIIVGCLPFYGDKVLLCKRAIEPRKDYWTLPAGFMENGETTEQGAARESFEEALAETTTLNLYCLYSVPEINQVFFFYRSELKHDSAFGVGQESLEVGLFSEHEIPWDNIAFYTVYKTLKYYFEDRKKNHYPVRDERIERPEKYKTAPIKPQISTR